MFTARIIALPRNGKNNQRIISGLRRGAEAHMDASVHVVNLQNYAQFGGLQKALVLRFGYVTLFYIMFFAREDYNFFVIFCEVVD